MSRIFTITKHSLSHGRIILRGTNSDPSRASENATRYLNVKLDSKTYYHFPSSISIFTFISSQLQKKKESKYTKHRHVFLPPRLSSASHK